MGAFDQKQIIILGGTSGLGLSIAKHLLNNYNCHKIVVTGRRPPRLPLNDPRLIYEEQDLNICKNWKFLEPFDVVIYCAGIGRIGHFNEFNDEEIIQTFNVNTIAPILMINSLYDKLMSPTDFRLVVITSISAKLVSPLFSIYSATKSCVSKYIQSVNIELEKLSTKNKILEIAPGYIDGTGFYNKETDLDKLNNITIEIFKSLSNYETFSIPENRELYEQLISDCNTDSQEFAKKSYDYKIDTIKKRTT